MVTHLADNFADQPESPIVDVATLRWSDLLPLGILLQQRGLLSNSNIEHQTSHGLSATKVPIDPQNEFHKFLEAWGIAPYFGFVGAGGGAASPDRVLGMHPFSRKEEAQKFASRWESNPEVEKIRHLKHRLVESGAINVICSELISNGLDHSVSQNQVRQPTPIKPVVFALSKVITPASMEVALRTNETARHLSNVQREIFEENVGREVTILELVIGDAGRGFGGNIELANLYSKDSLETKDAIVTEIDLIKYAQHPTVTTRTEPSFFLKNWEEYLDPDLNLDSVAHGLSEVLHYVQKYRGYWRIHSNNAFVRFDCRSGLKSVTQGYGIRTIGCINHLLFPLIPPEPIYKRPSKSQKPETRTPTLQILDLARFINQPRVSAKTIAEGFISLGEDLGRRTRQNGSGLIVSISVSSLNTLVGDELKLAASWLVGTFHRMRGSVAVILLGSKEELLSEIRRIISIPKEPINGLIFQSVRFSDTEEGGYSIAVLVSHDLEGIQDELARVLDPFSDYSLLLSDYYSGTKDISKRVDQIETVVRLHPQLLEATVYGAGSDAELRGRLKSRGNSDIICLIGSWGLSESIDQILDANEAVQKEPLIHQGKVCEGFIHVGKLWPVKPFVGLLEDWAGGMAQFLLSNDKTCEGASVTIIGVLHPAIELAHSLATHPLYRTARVLEVRALSSVRWDNQQFWEIPPGNQVLVIMDVAASGGTIQRLSDALEKLEIKISGVIAVIRKMEFRQRWEFPVVSFAEREIKTKQLAVNASPSVRRSVDADTQFTYELSERGSGKGDERLSRMCAANGLGLGHRYFGDQHHSIYLALRHLELSERMWIASSVVEAARSHFEKNGPDVVIFPGQSTICYLVEAILAGFSREGSSPSIGLLVPARDTFGGRVARIELSPKVRSRTDRLSCLFIDDSRSTGVTEHNAVSAVFESTKAVSIDWLSYFILSSPNPSYGAVTTGKSRGTKQRQIKFNYNVHCFIETSLLSASASQCMLCHAKKNLHFFSDSSLRPAVNDWRIRALSILEEKEVQDETVRDGLLNPTAVGHFLKFSALPLAQLAFYIHFKSDSDRSNEEIAALAILIALRFHDLSGYITSSQYQDHLIKFCTKLSEDGEFNHLLLIIAGILPVSTALNLVEKCVPALLDSGNIDLASCIRLLVENSLKQTLAKLTAGELKTSIERRLLDDFDRGLSQMLTSANSRISSGAGIIHLDSLLYRQSDLPNLVRQMAQVCTLMEEGRHIFFLKSNESKIETSEVKDLARNIVHISASLRTVALRLGLNVASKIERLIDQLSQSTLTDVSIDTYRASRQDLKEVWQFGELAAIRYKYQRIRQIVLNEIAKIRRPGDVAGDIFECSRAGAEVDSWIFMGPPTPVMQAHIENLLQNVVKYVLPGVLNIWTPPLCRIDFGISAAYFWVAFLDKGAPARRSELFARVHGLSAGKAYFQSYGGDVLYCGGVDQNSSSSEIPEHVRSLLKGDYVNAFITTLPLLVNTGYKSDR